MNSLEATVREIHLAAETYYSIGATLEEGSKPGRDLKISMTTTRPGVELRMRRHFVTRGPGDDAQEAARALVHFGSGVSGIPVELTLGAPVRKGGLGTARVVPYQVKIPIESLVVEEGAGARQADVELLFIVVDERGDTSDTKTQAARLNVPDAEWEQARKAVWPCAGSLLVRPGRNRVTVTVRDVRSSRLGSAEGAAAVD